MQKEINRRLDRLTEICYEPKLLFEPSTEKTGAFYRMKVVDYLKILGMFYFSYTDIHQAVLQAWIISNILTAPDLPYLLQRKSYGSCIL